MSFISERHKFLWMLTIFRRGKTLSPTSNDPEDFVGLEISVTRNQFHKQRGSGNALSEVNSPAAAAISGWWKGDVTYGWGLRYTEQFLFQPEGDKLCGTAFSWLSSAASKTAE